MIVYLCAKFCCDRSPDNDDTGGGGCRPQAQRFQKSPVQSGLMFKIQKLSNVGTPSACSVEEQGFGKLNLNPHLAPLSITVGVPKSLIRDLKQDDVVDRMPSW